jgi:uncharacterized membrane protein YphA (DoxX/SURF4 family)
VGRLFLSAIFFVSGFNKATDIVGTSERLAETIQKSAFVPDAIAPALASLSLVLAWGAVAFEWIGALLVATGLRPRAGAWLLILFLIPTTLLFHPPNDPRQLTQFLKNLAIVGGLLLVGTGPGRSGRTP